MIRKVVPSKLDNFVVHEGDRLIFETWGGAGWGDPLDRPAEAVRYDVATGLVTVEGAKRYGVVIVDGKVDESETAVLRHR